MGKFGLQKVEKSSLIPTGQPSRPASEGTHQKISGNQNVIGKIALKHSAEIVALVGDIVHGKIEIARIEAQTDAQVRIIAAEVDKIWKEANAKINLMEAEGREWEKKFDKKKELLLEVINKISASPQLDKEERLAVINAVTVAINQP